VGAEEKWVKFCGLEVTWQAAGLLLGQPCYAASLLKTRPEVRGTQFPFPKVELVEELNITAEEVHAAQSVVGELPWLSARTRPDLSFGVLWMGRRVTKSPRQVVKFAGHMLGYVKETQHLCLRYQGCQGDHGPLQELPLPRKTTGWRSMRMPVLHQKEVGASMGRLGCMVVEWSHGHRAFSP